MRSYSKLFASAVIAVSAIASVSASLAADLAPRYKAPPVAAPVMIYNWSGCYIGGNIGGGWKRNSLNTTTTFLGTPVAFTNLGSDNGSSVIGGAQIGCDYQFAGNWVAGVQGMFDFHPFRHVVVDEAQDLGPRELKLVATRPAESHRRLQRLSRPATPR